MWGWFLMSGVKILHFLKDWWKSIPIHQNYTMALSFICNTYILGMYLHKENHKQYAHTINHSATWAILCSPEEKN